MNYFIHLPVSEGLFPSVYFQVLCLSILYYYAFSK